MDIHSKMRPKIRIQINFQLNPDHSLEVIGGIGSFMREEKYKDENYRIKNSALFPHGGVGYKMHHQKSEFSLSGLYIKKLLSGTNTYDVTMKSLNIEHLDFQHAFSPYAYYNSTYSCINISGTYVYHLEKYGIGVNLKWMYKKGDRNKDAIYTGQIGFESSAPLINKEPDRHNGRWFSSSLFFVF